jgi:hypothetical protein
MKSAALDLGLHNITVNALVLGLVATDMTMNKTRLTQVYRDYRPQPNTPLTSEEEANVRAEYTPFSLPWLQSEDMAPMAVFLASDEAARISDTSFDVDVGDSAVFTALVELQCVQASCPPTSNRFVLIDTRCRPRSARYSVVSVVPKLAIR